MKRYRNLSGDSGVARYEILPHGIVVEFAGGDRYLYDDRFPGTKQVERMKELALAGKGLSTFISQAVRENYAKKIC